MSLSDDLTKVMPGMSVLAKLGSDGATWSNVSGWSGGTPGSSGQASVLANHGDGTLDLQVTVQNADPRGAPHVENFISVPHISLAERTSLQVLGPCWWLRP